MTLPDFSQIAQFESDEDRVRRGFELLAITIGVPFENWTSTHFWRAMAEAVTKYALPVPLPQVTRKRGRPLGGLFTLGRRLEEEETKKRNSPRSRKRIELLTLFTGAHGIDPVDAAHAQILIDYVHHSEWRTVWSQFLVHFASKYPSDVRAREDLLERYARATSKSQLSTKARYRTVLRNQMNDARDFLNLHRK